MTAPALTPRQLEGDDCVGCGEAAGDMLTVGWGPHGLLFAHEACAGTWLVEFAAAGVCPLCVAPRWRDGDARPRIASMALRTHYRRRHPGATLPPVVGDPLDDVYSAENIARSRRRAAEIRAGVEAGSLGPEWSEVAAGVEAGADEREAAGGHDRV